MIAAFVPPFEDDLIQVPCGNFHFDYDYIRRKLRVEPLVALGRKRGCRSSFRSSHDYARVGTVFGPMMFN